MYQLSFLVQTVSKDVAKAIQAGRQTLGITQKDLAQVSIDYYLTVLIFYNYILENL